MMIDYFLEFEFSSQNVQYWLPIFVKQTDSENANKTNDSVKEALEKKYENVEAKKPVFYKQGITSNYINKYVTNRFRGNIQRLIINKWEISESEYEQAIDFANLKAIDSSGCSFAIANSQEFTFPILKIERWPPTENIETFVIHVFQKNS